jgi:hypothetical protein
MGESMNIKNMAQKAWGNTDPSIDSVSWYENLERFAALVSAAEREECAKVCEEYWGWTANANEMADLIRKKN